MSRDPVSRLIRRSTLRLLVAAMALSGFSVIAAMRDTAHAGVAAAGAHAAVASRGGGDRDAHSATKP